MEARGISDSVKKQISLDSCKWGMLDKHCLDASSGRYVRVLDVSSSNLQRLSLPADVSEPLSRPRRSRLQASARGFLARAR